MPIDTTYLCPDCGRPLTMVEARPGKPESDRRWYCPIAVEAQRRGILGQPGRKHKEALIYMKGDI